MPRITRGENVDRKKPSYKELVQALHSLAVASDMLKKKWDAGDLAFCVRLLMLRREDARTLLDKALR